MGSCAIYFQGGIELIKTIGGFDALGVCEVMAYHFTAIHLPVCIGKHLSQHQVVGSWLRENARSILFQFGNCWSNSSPFTGKWSRIHPPKCWILYGIQVGQVESGWFPFRNLYPLNGFEIHVEPCFLSRFQGAEERRLAATTTVTTLTAPWTQKTGATSHIITICPRIDQLLIYGGWSSHLEEEILISTPTELGWRVYPPLYGNNPSLDPSTTWLAMCGPSATLHVLFLVDTRNPDKSNNAHGNLTMDFGWYAMNVWRMQFLLRNIWFIRCLCLMFLDVKWHHPWHEMYSRH